MNLFTRLAVVSATAFVLFTGTSAQAQTALLPSTNDPVYSGANMTAQLNGTQDSLIVTVEVFYDCPSAVFWPDTMILIANCGLPSMLLPQVSDDEISDVCPATFPICGAGGNQGERRVVFQGPIPISPFTACSPATFRIYPYNRVDADNLSNPSTTSDRMRVVMDIYFALDSLNNLPVFGSSGHPAFCGGTTQKFDPQVTDADGDSLVFSFRQPQRGIASPTNIPYATGFSLADPLGTGATIDSETGIITFTAPDSGLFQMVIQVDEYDRATGNQIGMVFRDFQFYVDGACSNVGPTVAASLSGISGGSLTSNYTVTLDTGVAASFSLSFTGSAGEVVAMASTVASVLNGALVSTSTVGTTTTMTINWTPGAADVGTHIISFSAEDNACDISGKNAQKVIVIVQEATIITPLQITSITGNPETCANANDGSIVITTTGGVGPISFTINGFNTAYTATQDSGTFLNLAPDFYIVNVGDSGASWDTTFSVTIQPSFFGFLGVPFNQIVDPTCDDACDGDARSRPNTFGVTPYTYLWSNGETTQKALNLCGGMHTVSITDNTGCTIVDSVTLVEPPAIFATLDSSFVVTCNGGSDGAAYVSGHGGEAASTSTAAYIIDQSEGTFEPYGVGESFNTQNYQSFTLGDDALSTAVNVGFNFDFFGSTYTTFQISSNGIIQFPGATSNAWQNVAIPNSNNPDNWIGIWDDLNPAATTNEIIETYVAGVTPNRVRVINYVGLRHFQSAVFYTFQIVLHETSNIIHIHTTNVPSFSEGGGNPGKTMGIENADGTLGYAVSGRNATNWSASNDHVAFIPISQSFSYAWSSIGSGTSATNLVAGTYTVTASNGVCSDTVQFTIAEPSAIVIDTVIVQPSCAGDSSGSITASASGGNGGPFTYAWNTGATTAAITNLGAGTYTVTATDVQACTEVLTIILTNPTPVVAAINVDNTVSCFGGNDGQLTASGLGGSPGYTFLWSNAATTASISGLSAGTYTVTVTDAQGCFDEESATITQPTALNAGIASSTNVSCVGGNDGSATASASGGTAGYSYLWSSGSTTQTANGLVAGTHTVTVTDSEGCTDTAQVVITEPASGVSISIATVSQVSCNGASDGSITANAATGGSSPYTYLWSTGGTTLTISGLSAGTYTITATDNGGCTTTADTTIGEPALLTLDTTSVTQPTCAGSNNGSITVAASGGTPAYGFLWNTGGTTATISGLVAGTYTVTVTDNNGCTDNLTVNLLNGPSITATITTNSGVLCNGGNSGSLTASGSNGTAPYTFLWSTAATTATISGLAAGTYTVTVTDDNGCDDVETVTLTEPGVLNAAIGSSSNVTCFGGNDGSATATASGGTAPYSFIWSSGATTATATGLVAGNYTVTVSDDNGCTDTAQVSITEPGAGVTISIASANQVTCNGDNDGSITANAATGGSAPYTYLWSTGGTALTINGLAAGTYTITVTDNGGCTSTADTTITEPALLTIDTTSTTQPTCAGSNNGSITVAANGGTPAYGFLWNTGATTTTINSLAAGSYTVTVTDNNGCTEILSVTLVNGPSITATITTNSGILCNGDNNGSLTASGSNGTAPYTFLWSTAATTATINGLSAGTYTVTVTDANGCEDIESATLTNPAALNAAIASSTNASCLGGNDGSATASASGGTAPYSFLWSSGATTATASGLTAGTYTVTVSDDNGCTDTAQVNITEPATGVGVNITSTNVACFGQSNGSATASGSGGTSPYTFLWSTGSTNATITGLAAGTYSVTVSDDNGCTGIDSVTITAPTSPVLAFTSTDSVSCFGANDGQIQVFGFGGTPGYTFLWNTGSTSNIISGLAAGTYTVTVTDANGCTDSETEILSGPAAVSLTFNTSDPTCPGNNDGGASVSPSGGSSPYTYLWSNAATSDSISGLSAGTYSVTVTDANGCQAIDSVTLVDGPGVVATVSAFDPSCAGESNGSAIGGVVGGTGTLPFSYLWNTGSTSQFLTGLAAGTYTLTVTDGAGCTDDTTVVLVDPTALTVSIIDSLDPTCGNTDGEAEALGAGGTGSLSYLWSSGGTAALETGLAAGTYTVTVTDGNACEATASVTLNAPAGFIATGAVVSNESCTGNDGSVTVNMSGGASPFTFLWSSGGTTQTISSLVAGTYTVTVTDNNGCTDTAVAIVADSCLCNWSATGILVSNVDCNGNLSGVATVSHSGAATPVTYLWSNGSTNDSLLNVAAGTYTVTVTDNDACVDTAEVIITQPVALVITGFTNINAPTCDDDCDGTATVVASGGSGTLSYSWSSGGTTAALTGLCGGGHYVTVTDGNGCEATDVIALVEPPALFAQVDSTDSVSCFGGSDGAAYLSAHGGEATSASTASYIIDQSEGTFEPYPTGRPWNAINYKTFALNDDATSDTINIFGGDNFSFFGVNKTHFIMNSQGFITFDLSNPNSGQVNGMFSTTSTIPSTAAATPKDFIAAYWHDLDPSVGNCTLETYLVGTAPNRIRVVNYIEIDHFATVAPNIISTFQIVLYESSNIIQIHSDSLNSDGGGHVQGIENFAGTVGYAVPGRNNTNFSASADYVAFIPSSQNFTYTWSSIGSGPSDTNLVAGAYTVTVSDGTCTDVVNFNIAQPATGPSVTMASTNSLCFVCSGTATATVTNATAPYTYVWSNSATNTTTSNSDTISALCSGPYAVTVTDANGCVGTGNTVVNDFFAPALNASSTDANCANTCDGTLTASYTCGSCGPAQWFVFPDTTTVIGTGDSLTGVCPGTYMVRITTSFSCSRYDTIDVGAPSALVLAMDSTDAGCTAATGSASVSVSGGTPTYSYLWSNASTNDTISNVVAGNYSVIVTDDNGCQDTGFVTVNSTAGFTAEATATANVSCFGGNDGAATATQTGTFLPPLSYAWSAGGTSQNISGLSAGIYTVTITDSIGCTATDTVLINEPDSMSFAFTETPISCGGSLNDGAISVAVSGGTPGYTYLWSTGGTTTSITGLTSGNYCLTVTDANGCDKIECYTLNPPGAFTVAIVDSADVLCFGDSNGMAVVQVQSSGSGNYSYLWSNASTNDTVNNLPAGIHSVTVTDLVSSCIDSATVIIDEPTLLVASIDSSSNNLCFNGTDGEAFGSASGGTLPYILSWSNGDVGSIADSLPAGTVTLTVTDANGCTATDDVVITQPATGLSASASVTTAPLCNGDSASVLASGSGGSGTYTFLWPNGATTASTLLPAGTYCVTVSDGGVCQDTACITVVDPSPVLAAITPTSPSCPGGNDGSLSASGGGGTPGYTYLWSTGSTNQNITGLSAGTYSVTVTDANGCEGTAVITLLDPVGMSAVFNNINTSACGTCNGSATAVISGGATPYDFTWLTGGSTAATGTGLCAGLNQVVVEDANGCLDTFAVNVPTLGADTVFASTLTNASCNGGTDGSAVATYACNTAPCTVAWFDVNTNTFQGSTDTITGLAAGSYYVQLTNDSGCVSFDTITITEPTPVLASITASTAVSCIGGNDGTASAGGSGGTPGYTFLWSNGSTSNNASGLTAGTHCVTVTDANGCTDTACVIITEPSTGISVTAQLIQGITCNGGNDASVTAFASGGTAPYTYTWNGTFVTDTLSNIGAGTYIVVAGDGGACTASDTIVLTAPSALTASFNNVIDPTCPGAVDGEASIAVSGGTPGYTYLWPSGNTTTSETGLADGTYCVTVSDANNCQDTFCVIISDPAGMTNTFSGISNSSCTVCDGTATANPTGGSGSTYTYLWNNGQSTAANDSLCAGINTVTITDSLGCSSVFTHLTNADGADTVAAIGIDPNCGTCDGEVIANYTCTSAPCTVVWTDLGSSTVVGTTDTVDSLCSGTYAVELTNAQGCVSTAMVSIAAPALIDPNATISDASCFGLCDASIALATTGGSGSYTYLWNTGATSATINGLCAGTYTVNINDGSGCDTTVSFTINEPSEIIDNAVITDASCGGTCDGQISSIPSGGAGGYSFNWSPTPGNGNGLSLASGLCAGDYMLTITDANGCTSIDTFTVNQPDSIVQDSVNLVNATCGECDGEIEAFVSGGAGGFTYAWTNGDNSALSDSLCFGLYELTVTDASGCFEVFAYPVSETNGPGVNITSTNATANGNCDGTATANITSSLGTTTYQWSNGDTTQMADSLCAGMYVVTVTDTNGCSTVDTITITEPTALLLEFVVADITCTGNGCDGEIEAIVSGGVAPYTYLWSNGAITPINTNLCAGTYVLTVTDANSQFIVDSVTLNDPQPFNITSVVNDVSCPDACDGSIALTITGGSGPLSVLWNTGDTLNTLSDLCGGTYTVTVTDTAGCSDSVSFIINEPAAIVVTVDSLNNPDCQVNNGAIAVTASGGNGGPYGYLWLDVSGAPLVPTQATSQATNLMAGIYNVAVVDVNGCEDTATVILNNINAPVITLDSLNNVSCFGECDGSIATTITGGTTPYLILWSTGATSDDIDSLCAGNDTIAVVDADFCASFDIYTITEPAALFVESMDIVNVNCGADCDGSISVQMGGGTMPYSYAWSNGSTDSVITDLCAGLYSLTVTDANGCTFTTTANVGGPAPMVITLDSIGDATCTNTGDGFIHISMGGGNAPYTYRWIYNAQDTFSTQDVQGALAGSYVLQVTDASGCVLSDSFEIDAKFFVSVDAMDDFEVCPNSNGVPLTGSHVGASSLRWLYSNGVVAGNGLNINVNTASASNLYVLEGINGVCVARDTVIVSWTPGPGLDAGPDRFIEPGESTVIGGAPTANAGVDITWTPALDITSVTDYNPTVNPLETRVYYISAVDADGCFGMDSVVVTVEEVIDPVGGFSPNGDGVNDFFIIDRIGDYPNAVVQIFNRWGNLIFESSAGYTDPWDGTYNGKPLTVGSYYYVIDLKDDKITRLITGPVTILK